MKRAWIVILVVIGLAIGVLLYNQHKKNQVYHIIIACHIIDPEGKILLNFSGHLCDFYSNGDYLSSGRKMGIEYFDRQNRKIWKAPEPVHHKVTISEDEKRIVLLSSKYEPYKDDSLMRWDKFVVMSRDGGVLAESTVDELIPQIFANEPLPDHSLTLMDPIKGEKPTYEYTHANSIFEIGPNAREKNVPWLKRGLYVVNLHRFGETVLFLDPTLKKVEHVIKLSEILGEGPKTHDIQVLENGNLLIYVNRTVVPGSTRDFYSRLVEVDPVSKTIVWQYVASPRSSFMSPYRGGVKILKNGQIIFSDETKGAGWVRWIDRSGKLLKSWPVPFKDPETNLPTDLQEPAVKDLTSFIENYQPL